MSNEGDIGNMDLNIDHYTVDELLDIFHINLPITKEKIKNTTDQIIQEYLVEQTDKNPDYDEDSMAAYVEFFEQAQDKLMDEYGFSNGSVVNNETSGILSRSSQVMTTNSYNKSYHTSVPSLLPTLHQNQVFNNQSENFVIKPAPLETRATYAQEHIAGVLNPIKRRIMKRALLIDTKFRSNYSSTSSMNFTIQLPTSIKNAVSMKLTAFEFPVSYYVFSDEIKSNIFTIIYNGIPQVITVKPGNYVANEMEDYLNNVVFSVAPFSGNVEASFDSKYGKFIIQLTASGIAAGDTIELDFRVPGDENRDLKLNMGWLLGFRKYLYLSEQSYEPEGMYDGGGSRYLYVYVNDFKNNVNDNFIGAFETSLTKTNILARISQPSATAEIIFDDTSDLILKKREYFGPVDIERIQLKILDEYERVLNNNNMDYSMTLEFECVYNL